MGEKLNKYSLLRQNEGQQNTLFWCPTNHTEVPATIAKIWQHRIAGSGNPNNYIATPLISL
jgi:hypothetical protein